MPDATLLGLPATFEFEGTSYPFQDPRDFEVEGLFGRWAAEQALLLIEQCRDVMRPETYQMQMDGWRRDAPLYRWNGDASITARFSQEGCKYLALLQMQRACDLLLKQGKPFRGPPVTPELVERIWRDPEKRREMQALVWEEHRRPKDPPARGEAAPQPEGSASPMKPSSPSLRSGATTTTASLS
jgi:hypothetical protein